MLNLKVLLGNLLFAGAYFALAKLGELFASQSFAVSLIWAPAGLAVGMLTRLGYRYVPGLVLGSILVNLVLLPWYSAVLITLGHLLGPLFAAYTLRSVRFQRTFDTTNDVLQFVFWAVGIAMLIPAANGVLWLHLYESLSAEELLSALLTWWLGDAAGVLLVGPLILAVQNKWFLSWQRDWSVRGHLSALLILLALGLLTMGPWFGTNPLRIGLLLIPLIAVLRSALNFRMAAMIDLFLFTVGLLYTYSHFDAGASSNVKQLGLVLIVVMVSFASLLVLAIAAITQERDVVERNLRTREAEYRTMVEDNPAMICRFGPDGLLLYANLTYRRMFGARVANQPWQFLPMPDGIERETLLRKLIPARVTDEANTVEMAIIVPNGDRRWFRWTTRAVDIMSGQVSELHAIGLDVTEQHIAEQERAEFSSKVVQMQRLESVGLLAGGVAHEFNNLLTGILGNVELLQMDLPPGTHHGDSLEVIARNSARASQLTRQLSVYAGRGVALTV
ncbi:MAG: MASE1 domain-containing protein, partial [Gemmataceae bacterium]